VSDRGAILGEEDCRILEMDKNKLVCSELFTETECINYTEQGSLAMLASRLY